MLLHSKAPTSIFESADLAGEFWLPDGKGKRVGGVIHLRPGQIMSLELFGAFDNTGAFNTRFEDHAVIHGAITQGKACSLLKTLQSGSQWTGFGTASEFHANYALLGAHTGSLDAATYSSARATFTGLAGFAGQPAFRETIEPRGANLLTAAAVHPPGFDVEVSCLDARIKLAGAISTTSNALEAVTWRYEPYLEVVSSQPKPLEWFLRVLDDLRNLISICTFSAVAAENVRLYVTPGDSDGPDVFRNTWLSKRPEPVAPHQMIVRLPVILPSIEATLLEWFALADVARPTIELFCGVLSRGLGISTFSFLALAQAAEAYHRCTYDGIYEAPSDFERHLKQIALPAEIPEALRQKLSNVLKYANEFSLRKRLADLFEALGPLSAVVSSDSRQAVSEIVEARNILTHQLRGSTQPAWPRLAYLSRILQLLLLGTILRRIGAPDPVIKGGLEELAGSLRFIGQP